MFRAHRIAYRQSRRRISKTFVRVPVVWLRLADLITREGHYYIRGGVVELIEQHAGEMMVRMGYELAGSHAGGELAGRFNDGR